ncbi:MAG: ECF-type sigma factor [Planctomycetota bacterium]|jgi:RNA polymerase sigma factor (TIGR02999 family)
MKLVDAKSASWNDRAHFCRVAARAMRQILVDHARKRNAVKRGGDMERMTLSDTVGMIGGAPLDLLALDEAMERLAALDERQARVVEFRFFGGITVQEIASVLDVSVSTVESDWRMARAGLHREIAGAEGR